MKQQVIVIKQWTKIIELYKENEHGTELVKDIERV